jgi:hypothetical protein
MEYTIYEHIPVCDLLLDLLPDIVIKNDREKYIKYMIIAEDFFIANSLICSDSTIFDDDKPTTYHYTVYCDDAQTRARQLAKLIYESDKTGLARYTTVMAKVPDQIYIVSVNMRELFLMANTRFGHHKRFDEIVQTIPKKALFTKKDIQCLEPLAQLNDVYYRLTDAGEVDEWPSLLKKEEILRKYLHDDSYIAKTSGLSISPMANHNTQNKQKQNKGVFVRDYLSTITDKVIVGQAAITIIAGGEMITKLQVISSNFEDDKRYLLTNMRRYNIYIKHEFPKIIGDDRHVKIVVYKNINHEHVPILEIFNAGDFTLIPYNIINNYDMFADSKNVIDPNDDDIWLHEIIKRQNLKVGTLFTIMRFLSYDLWQDKCSMYFLDADKEELQEKINYNLSLFYKTEEIMLKLFQEIDTTTDKGASIDKLLPSRRYKGNYTKLSVELKRNISKKDIYKMNKYLPLFNDIPKDQ